jgi:glycosyltransferase domain-containing protein
VTPEEVALLSELTIVIPTYNRPFQLERAIEYWRDTPVTVHILDGSEKPWFSIGVCPGTNTISYNHLPQNVGESSADNYSRRIALATELVKTNFSALCSDDDLFTIRGLVTALQVLKSDQADAVVGKCAQYLFRDGKVEWKKINWDWRSDHLSQSRNFLDHFASDSKGSYYYGIYETSIWKKIRLSGVDQTFSHVGANETISDYLTKILTRNFVINEYLWFTNYPDQRYPNIVGRSRPRFTYKYPKFSSWLNAEENIAERNLLINVLESGFKKLRSESDWHLANFFGRTILLSRPRPPKISAFSSFMTLLRARMLFLISKFPKVVRKTLFNFLPKKYKRILRTYDFIDSRIPVIDIEGDDPELAEAIRIWERILLMSREELRLRANI